MNGIRIKHELISHQIINYVNEDFKTLLFTNL